MSLSDGIVMTLAFEYQTFKITAYLDDEMVVRVLDKLSGFFYKVTITPNNVREQCQYAQDVQSMFRIIAALQDGNGSVVMDGIAVDGDNMTLRMKLMNIFEIPLQLRLKKVSESNVCCNHECTHLVRQLRDEIAILKGIKIKIGRHSKIPHYEDIYLPIKCKKIIIQHSDSNDNCVSQLDDDIYCIAVRDLVLDPDFSAIHCKEIELIGDIASIDFRHFPSRIETLTLDGHWVHPNIAMLSNLRTLVIKNYGGNQDIFRVRYPGSLDRLVIHGCPDSLVKMYDGVSDFGVEVVMV